MSNTSKNVVSNGLVGSTVSVGYGATPPTHNLPGYVGASQPLTIGQVYTTNNTSLGGGSSGQFLTSGSNGTGWTNLADNVLVAKNNPPELEVKGRMILNGRDVEERLNTIEKVLQIPERDAILERKHPKLKKLHDEYIKELSKYRMWQAIKGDE